MYGFPFFGGRVGGGGYICKKAIFRPTKMETIGVACEMTCSWRAPSICIRSCPDDTEFLLL